MKKIVAIALLACNVCFANGEEKFYQKRVFTQTDLNFCIDRLIDPEVSDVQKVGYFVGLKHMYYLNGDWERGDKIAELLSKMIRNSEECKKEYFRIWECWD